MACENPETRAQEFKQFRVDSKWINDHLAMDWFTFRKKWYYKMLRCPFWKHPVLCWYTLSCQCEGRGSHISHNSLSQFLCRSSCYGWFQVTLTVLDAGKGTQSALRSLMVSGESIQWKHLTCDYSSPQSIKRKGKTKSTYFIPYGCLFNSEAAFQPLEVVPWKHYL